MSMRPKYQTPSELAKIRRRARRLPVTRTLVERERDIVDAVEDRARLDWLSQGEDTGSSNLYDLWQCMLSHEPSKLREVIDYLRKKKCSKSTTG